MVSEAAFAYWTLPARFTMSPRLALWSGPALTIGAPGERGPSLGPVVCTTSKLVTESPVMWLKAPEGHRRSGTTEIEKKLLLLSAIRPPYFLSAAAMAFSSFVQFAGTLKPALSRRRWPMAGTFGFVVTGEEAEWVAG